MKEVQARIARRLAALRDAETFLALCEYAGFDEELARRYVASKRRSLDRARAEVPATGAAVIETLIRGLVTRSQLRRAP